MSDEEVKTEETTEEKKPSYVGPKRVAVTFRGDSEPLFLNFPTSISYKKGLKTILENPDEENVVVKKGLNRFDVDANYVTSVIFPAEELELRKSSKVVINVELVFELGVRYLVPIAGENRMRIVYKKLQELMGKTPDEDHSWIEINQEENKKAYIKHQNPLIAVKATGPTVVVDEPTETE